MRSTFLGADVLRAKKQKYLHNLSTGIGGAWAAISRSEAMAMTTQTVNPCRLVHPCRSLFMAVAVANAVRDIKPYKF